MPRYSFDSTIGSPILTLGDTIIFKGDYYSPESGVPVWEESPPPSVLLLSGDQQSGSDHLLLSGDQQSGADRLILTGSY